MAIQTLLTHRKEWESVGRTSSLRFAKELKHRTANDFVLALERSLKPSNAASDTKVTRFGRCFDWIVSKLVLSIADFELR